MTWIDREEGKTHTATIQVEEGVQHNYRVSGATWSYLKVARLAALYMIPQMVHNHEEGKPCNPLCMGVPCPRKG